MWGLRLWSHHSTHYYRFRREARFGIPSCSDIEWSSWLSVASNERGDLSAGKSAGNAIWLDGEMTSPYSLFQYFMQTDDADVERYLKLFTFMEQRDIEQLVEQHQKTPELRSAQRQLALYVIILIFIVVIYVCLGDYSHSRKRICIKRSACVFHLVRGRFLCTISQGTGSQGYSSGLNILF
jgi:hypothetical protein